MTINGTTELETITDIKGIKTPVTSEPAVPVIAIKEEPVEKVAKEIPEKPRVKKQIPKSVAKPLDNSIVKSGKTMEELKEENSKLRKELEEENNKLRRQLLESYMSAPTKEVVSQAVIKHEDNEKVVEQIETEEDYSTVKIQQDDYISVMSLLPYTLNLSTREQGQGSIKKFTKFGETKKIVYKDLVDIMEVHQNFLEAGYFYILNPVLIRHHGLDEIYAKILTKDKIEQILYATNSDECLNLYNSANQNQQEIIVQLLTDKVHENIDSINLNIVEKISKASGVDIVKRAQEAKELSTKPEN